MIFFSNVQFFFYVDSLIKFVKIQMICTCQEEDNKAISIFSEFSFPKKRVLSASILVKP